MRQGSAILAAIVVGWCVHSATLCEALTAGAIEEETLAPDPPPPVPRVATPAPERSPISASRSGDPTARPSSVPRAPAWGAVDLLRRTIAPGDKRRLAFPRSSTVVENLVDVPVLVVRGERPGPTLCLTAGIHGDELNGVEIARYVFEHAVPTSLSGMLIALPIINMHGFRTGARYLPSQRDLNRAFPGTETGSPAARMAHGVFVEVIRRCDALIDLHTGSLQRTNLPQVRADLAAAGVRALALAFGVEIVLDGRGPRGSLRAAAVDAGIPTILYEAGEPLRFQDDEIAHGVEGVRRVMAYLAMLDESEPPRRRPRVFRDARWVRADSDGIFRPDRTLGDVVAKGEVLGTVTDPVTNARTRVVATWSGRIVGMATPQVVLSGFALFHLGLGEEEPPVGDSVRD